ncbi:MAG: hypothetical protein IJO88_08375 [Oscillospiraceae bacterium]|nr:hypothetical protein [Oscillospiraceae bacterium]
MFQRKQFTFYDSFYTALSNIDDEAERLLAYETVIRYALYAEAPDLSALTKDIVIAYLLIKPNLDAARRKAEAGKRGGEAGSKQEANGKQTESDREADVSKGEIE